MGNIQVKFNQTKYNAVDRGHFINFDFQISIIKGENDSIDDILNEARNAETVEIYLDDTLIAVYDSYTQFKSLFVSSETMITVMMTSTDIMNQLNNISNTVIGMENSINSLEDSQATQDLAIEDLGEAISDLES